MNRLMQQVNQPDQIRGRESRVRVDRARRKIAYKAQNGMEFIIDTKPTETGGNAVVENKLVKRFSASHSRHTLGNGRVCLANNLRGWDLTRILFQCDSWARGYEIYKKTGTFPDSPKQVFSKSSHRQDTNPLTSAIRRFL